MTPEANQFSLTDLLACVGREVGMRKNCYPKWDKVTSLDALSPNRKRELAMMEQLYAYLQEQAATPAPAFLEAQALANENPLAVVHEVLNNWLDENEATDFDENDVANFFALLGTAGYSIVPNAHLVATPAPTTLNMIDMVGIAPASDEMLSELEQLLARVADEQWFVVADTDEFGTQFLITPQQGSKVGGAGNHNDLGCFAFAEEASLAVALRNNASALLARLRQAQAVRPWLPTTEMLAVPEGQTVRLWVCIEGVVSELLYGYRVEMDENWDDDEPYTGWFEEGTEDGMPVYHGPLPTHYKEQEPAPAAPTVKGGQQDA